MHVKTPSAAQRMLGKAEQCARGEAERPTLSAKKFTSVQLEVRWVNPVRTPLGYCNTALCGSPNTTSYGSTRDSSTNTSFTKRELQAQGRWGRIFRHHQ